jgi:hypothetical protein
MMKGMKEAIDNKYASFLPSTIPILNFLLKQLESAFIMINENPEKKDVCWEGDGRVLVHE